MSLCALLAASACAVPSPLDPSDGPFRFSGTISGIAGGRLGAPIAGAVIKVVKGVNAEARTSTDAGGRFAFDHLETGRFTVEVTAPGYVAVLPVVDLYRDVDATFALQPR